MSRVEEEEEMPPRKERTFARRADPGRPLSRAKAQVIRDAVAR